MYVSYIELLNQFVSKVTTVQALGTVEDCVFLHPF